MSTSAVQSPFSLVPQAIDPGTSLSIPLHLVNLEGGGFKVGIEVTLTDPQTQATVEGILYEFDTGGKGFFASIPPAQQQVLPLPPNNLGWVYDKYSSGIQYFGNAAYLDVSFPDSGSTQSFRMLVGYVNAMSNLKPDAPPDERQFPIFGAFYGDFGGSLQASPIVASGNGGTTPNTDQASNTVSLLTVLEQLPAPYGGSGFIVNLGPNPGNASPSYQSSVIVGLTPALREAFPVAVPMNTLPDPAYPPAGQTEPPGSVQTFPEQILTGTLTINGQRLENIPIVLDTGAPSTTLHHGPGLPELGETPKELTLTVTTPSGQTVTLLDFTVGKETSVNQVREGGDRSEKGSNQSGPVTGYINTGIAAFFKQPICFDFGEKVVRFGSAS